MRSEHESTPAQPSDIKTRTPDELTRMAENIHQATPIIAVIFQELLARQKLLDDDMIDYSHPERFERLGRAIDVVGSLVMDYQKSGEIVMEMLFDGNTQPDSHRRMGHHTLSNEDSRALRLDFDAIIATEFS